MKPAPETRESRLTPLDYFTRQMLLGTLLGDGSMVWRQPRVQFGRFQIRHGAAQEAYCRHKAAVLAPYVRTPPRIVRNPHFGDHHACTFSTVTSPAFEALRHTCYRLVEGRFVKHVSRSWVDRLDWIALAYWYMDDGSLKRDGSIIISTHGFKRREVSLLLRRLRELGVKAIVDRTRRGEKTYWTLRLRKREARTFLVAIARYAHPSMLYKVVLPLEPSRPCVCCGAEVLVGYRHRARFLACARRICRSVCRTRTREANDAHRREQKRISRRQIGGAL